MQSYGADFNNTVIRGRLNFSDLLLIDNTWLLWKDMERQIKIWKKCYDLGFAKLPADETLLGLKRQTDTYRLPTSVLNELSLSWVLGLTQTQLKLNLTNSWVTHELVELVSRGAHVTCTWSGKLGPAAAPACLSLIRNSEGLAPPCPLIKHY